MVENRRRQARSGDDRVRLQAAPLDHPVLFLVVTLIFFMMRSIGGDPFRHGPLLGLNAQGGWVKYGDYQPPAIRRNLAERYGLASRGTSST